MKRKRINIEKNKFPPGVFLFLADAPVYDSSCSMEAKVYFIEKDSGYFLKTSAAKSLETEAIMTKYFNSKGLSAKVCLYIQDEIDYLITEKISGEDGTAGHYLSDPQKLCKVFAETLARLHRTDFSDCPLKSKTSAFVSNPVFTSLIHGDYCLPNIILDNFEFSGLLDLDHAGSGDPYRDISSALWTLTHNLKTDKYNDLFLDCYGRDKIDLQKLKSWEGL